MIKPRLNHSWLALLLLLIMGQLSANDALHTALQQHLTSSQVAGSTLSFALWEPTSPEPVYAYHDSLYVIPASVHKIFTAATALHHLGQDYQWHTTLAYQGKLVRGRLEGDLLVIGGGDPTWNEDYWENGAKQLFQNWADSLLTRGITHIEGNLIANVSHFPTREYNPHWDKDDRPYYYAPAVSSLPFNANRIIHQFEAGDKAGDPVKISVIDDYEYFTVENSLTTGKPNSRLNTWAVPLADSLSYTLMGTVPANTKAVEKLALRRPEYFVIKEFREVLEQNGISVAGQILVQGNAVDYDQLELLFVQDSPHLNSVVSQMVKTSSNFLAESILHSLAADYDEALRQVGNTLQELGVGMQNFRFQDGCGLSRDTRLSTREIGALLYHARIQPWFDAFFSALPISGVDGTLSNRMQDNKVKGRVFAKTGGMTGISTMAGYIQHSDERLLAFAILNSGFKNSAHIRQWQDELLGILCEMY
ncbi:MAG: D-alanyl-D-alanine carboxypeptidase/D-alanyl-D-alanine-endopeptidase [Candidatus Cloacimonetes bacterium]|nr:D-alanyl-D-alanine carboxypeptidase/D-alanyl-D-alanine-endopeptidase [Candidatus Cloacimonadota bacterium]